MRTIFIFFFIILDKDANYTPSMSSVFFAQ